MAGKIPDQFIDSLMARVDIVDVIDRRVPLTKKGKEYQACCPFHDEKTPSFTVSPGKQFYHCFGCGAHGTAIGFLMDYANLDFVETIEQLAESVGLEVPREGDGGRQGHSSESPNQLLSMVDQASNWFQQQLRTHAEGKAAIAYLKSRGLDGRICASFGVGLAPDSWDGLRNALGKNSRDIELLHKAGLLSKRDNGEGYDRFRGRVIFPIEDHRGRVVAFGGRILGDGEPKYLNSPETALFHKGAELYGLNRARRAIGNEHRSVVVEGYMDVISLAQFGVDNAVATLGTATTRVHLQRLFRLAPEVVFCFDGDRAGRDAAWKAMQVALPEMQDGRQLGFLFLPDGEDPDTIVRSEGGEAFRDRVNTAIPLDKFLFDSLESRVDMSRMDGKAKLVSMARPLIRQLPDGAYREMMSARLSMLAGIAASKLGDMSAEPSTPRHQIRSKPLEAGQMSLMAQVISVLLQHPELGRKAHFAVAAKDLRMEGADHLREILGLVAAEPATNTARILEHFRDAPIHSYLEKLASCPNSIASEALEQYFGDALDRLVARQSRQRREELLDKSRQQGLDDEEQRELNALFNAYGEQVRENTEQGSGGEAESEY